MNPNDRKILKRALASLPPSRRASLEGILLQDADPVSKNQNRPEFYYGMKGGIQASLREDLAEDADPASGDQNKPESYYGLPPKGVQASGKPVRLTPKEIARADYEIPDRPFTIVVRPQADGRYWVAAIDVNTGHPLLGWGNPNLGQMFVDEKSHIPSAVRMIGRDLHKHTGFATNMTDQMRHQHYKGVQASGKTARYRYGAEADLIDDALPPRAQALYTKLVTVGKLRSNLMRELKEAMLATAATLPIDQRRAALAVDEMLNPENYQ